MARLTILDTTGSTNADILAHAAVGGAEGDWIAARIQTGGRGRQGRTWDSPPGNLYASTLVRLDARDPAAPGLALVAAVAAEEVLATRLPAPMLTIKWPNDVLADGGKIVGILLERSGDAVAVGIGINLAHAPAIPGRATASVAALAGGAPTPDDLLVELADAFARWLALWRTGGDAVRTRWLSRAHPVGTALSVQDAAGEAVQGLFDGLGPDGALRLRLADGAVRVIHAGDVFLV